MEVFYKIIKPFYKLSCKIIYLILPPVSKLLIFLRLHSRIINQLNKLRLEAHLGDSHIDLIKNIGPKRKKNLLLYFGSLNEIKKADLNKYPSDTFKKLGEILTGAPTFRFDGSDLMPGAIGAGSFWTGMVDYTNGKSAKDVAASIQASWDSIK